MFEKEAEEYANGKGHEHYNYLEDIIAWKEIVLPELKESE